MFLLKKLRKESFSQDLGVNSHLPLQFVGLALAIGSALSLFLHDIKPKKFLLLKRIGVITQSRDCFLNRKRRGPDLVLRYLPESEIEAGLSLCGRLQAESLFFRSGKPCGVDQPIPSLLRAIDKPQDLFRTRRHVRWQRAVLEQCLEYVDLLTETKLAKYANADVWGFLHESRRYERNEPIEVRKPDEHVTQLVLEPLDSILRLTSSVHAQTRL